MKLVHGRLMQFMNLGTHTTTIITTITKYVILTSPKTLEVEVEIQTRQHVTTVRLIYTQIAAAMIIIIIVNILIPPMMIGIEVYPILTV